MSDPFADHAGRSFDPRGIGELSLPAAVWGHAEKLRLEGRADGKRHRCASRIARLPQSPSAGEHDAGPIRGPVRPQIGLGGSGQPDLVGAVGVHNVDVLLPLYTVRHEGDLGAIR